MMYLDCGCVIMENGFRVFCPTCENPAPPAACKWTQDADEFGTWYSACGEAHIFTAGTPRENKYAFCPYCGRRLEQAEAE